MRTKLLLGAALLGASGLVLPAPSASACITVWFPVIGSICDPNPCRGTQDDYDRLREELPFLPERSPACG